VLGDVRVNPVDPPGALRRFGSPQVGISVVGGPTGGAGRPSQACGVSFADERAASSGDGIRDPGRIVAVEWRGLARRGKRGPLLQAGVLEMFVCLHLRWQGNPRTKARSWQEIGTYRRKRGPPLAPRSTPKSSVYTAYLILRCAPAASGHVAAVPPMSVMNSRRLIAFPSRTSKNFDGTPGLLCGKIPVSFGG